MVPNRLRRTGETGQALVEAALLLPVLLIVVFGVVAVGRVVQAKIAVEAAAREASRTLASAASEQEGLAASVETGRSVAEGYGLSGDRLTVDVASNGFARGGRVSAEVSYSIVLSLPLINLADVVVSSTHTERVDLYRSRDEVSGP